MTRRVRDFQQRFPGTALVPDAEVLALQALRAQGAHMKLIEQAQVFLQRYPHDLHTPLVRALLSER